MKVRNTILFTFFLAIIGINSAQNIDSLRQQIGEHRSLGTKGFDSVLLQLKDLSREDQYQLLWMYEHGWNLTYLNQYDSALYYAEKGLKMAIEIKDTNEIVSFRRFLGTVYYYTQQRDKSLKTFKAAIKIAKPHHDYGTIAALHNNIGGIYADTKAYDSAKFYLEKAIAIREQYEVKTTGFLLQTKRLLASTLHRTGHISESKTLMIDVLNTAIELEEPVQTAAAMIYLSDILFEEKEYEAGISYLKKAIPYLKKAENKDGLMLNYSNLQKQYSKQGNYDSAYHFLNLRTELQSEIYSKQMADNISKLEVQLETERIKLEKQLAEQETNSKHIALKASQNKFRLSLIIGALACIMLLILVLLLYQRKQTIEAKQEKAIQLERTQSLIEGEEQERERLSRELHDGVGQLLAGVKMNMNALKIDDKDLNQLLDKSIQEVRNISHDLLPQELQNQKLSHAIGALTKRIDDLSEIKVTFESGLTVDVDQSIKKQLYRITQELLNNGIKHSKAKSITIRLLEGSKLITLSYQDDGKGISEKVLEFSNGIGWRNILARLEMIKGSLKINTVDKGSSVIVKVPTEE